MKSCALGRVTIETQNPVPLAIEVPRRERCVHYSLAHVNLPLMDLRDAPRSGRITVGKWTVLGVFGAAAALAVGLAF